MLYCMYVVAQMLYVASSKKRLIPQSKWLLLEFMIMKELVDISIFSIDMIKPSIDSERQAETMVLSGGAFAYRMKLQSCMAELARPGPNFGPLHTASSVMPLNTIDLLSSQCIAKS